MKHRIIQFLFTDLKKKSKNKIDIILNIIIYLGMGWIWE